MGARRRRKGAIGRGSRITVVVLAATAAFSGSLEAQRSSSASGSTCGRDGSKQGDLGIGTFHCQGGSCLVGGIWATTTGEQLTAVRQLAQDAPHVWDFSTEPRLWEIDPDGPAANRIQEGDILVAVNGAPVTTRAAGRQLASMKAGTAVDLTLRRDGTLVRVEVVPSERCQPFTVSSGPAELPYFLTQDPRGVVRRRETVDRSLSRIPTGVGRVSFEAAGFVLAGATEVRVAAGGRVRWRFVDDPVVAEVLESGPADRNGIVPGEVIVQAGANSLTTEAGVAALASAGPGTPVVLLVRRGQSNRQVEISGDPGVQRP